MEDCINCGSKCLEYGEEANGLLCIECEANFGSTYIDNEEEEEEEEE